MTTPMSAEKTPTLSRGRSDLLCGLGVLVGGSLLLVSALGIDTTLGTKAGIGPGTVPVALATLLMAGGAALLFTGIRAARASHTGTQTFSQAASDVEALLKEAEPPVPLKKLLVMVLLFVGYAVAFIPLGYVLSTAVFLGIVVTVIDPAKWKRNVLFALGFSAIVYLGFTQLLGVPLPVGVLGSPVGG
ncbi:tripartite tricarboxylate transporter TctB family protein [Arthrobacter sp. C152]